MYGGAPRSLQIAIWLMPQPSSLEQRRADHLRVAFMWVTQPENSLEVIVDLDDDEPGQK